MLMIGFSYADFYWLLCKQMILPCELSRVERKILPFESTAPYLPVITNLCAPREFLKKNVSVMFDNHSILLFLL